MAYLSGATGVADLDVVVADAITYYDRGVCAVLVEGSRAVLHHRDGTHEDLAPEPSR